MHQSVTAGITIEDLWREAGFTPNQVQREAILHVHGPLYLPAGPGSGKTRVLLWRTLNLCVFHGVQPEQVFLSTFTEKAAFQLKEGLRALLGQVTNRSGIPYDLSKMYIGTVHSLCQRLITDRRFYLQRHRGRAPYLLDELAQYFFVYKRRFWAELVAASDLGDDAALQINGLFGTNSRSRHRAAVNAINLFNRLSEECLDPDAIMPRVSDPVLKALVAMYRQYVTSLHTGGATRTDFSLLQQKAFEVISAHEEATEIFSHVIIDEYQDTNTIQERIFFRLAQGHGNICVVGDDDQALYRFRGATVENFVEFGERCLQYLGVTPRTIPLTTNYRSRQDVVTFYTRFINECDWKRHDGTEGSYRVASKNIQAYSADRGAAVATSAPDKPERVCAEIAGLVRQLIDTGRVTNANQIAFLWPSMKYQGHMTEHVRRMKEALEEVGLRVYAPRAGRFLEVPESTDLFGMFLQIFGMPKKSDVPGADYREYHEWLEMAHDRGKELMHEDRQLSAFVADRRAELAQALADYQLLLATVARQGWDRTAPYVVGRMKRALYSTPRLSEKAKKTLVSRHFEKIVEAREAQGNPLNLEYILRRTTSIDWSLMDLFYRLSGFTNFRRMLDLAESGEDEGPACNLGLLTQYLARFMDEYTPIISADYLADDKFLRIFFVSYLFALFRRGESEYEDADDPFPKGRVPFLTVHQSKGLEFPVVVLGNLRKDHNEAPKIEQLVQPLVQRSGEPLDRMAEFDTMRMFYVALSRAKNLVVLAYYKGQGIRINAPFRAMLDDNFPRIAQLDLAHLPETMLIDDALPRNYSFTGDYLAYQTCPRQYMIFHKYGFVPARSQTMMFGSLVHQTLDDLHQYLIAQRGLK
jgi:DNA helicase-2/ATP-dependent DNA helicase PcrA